MYIDTPTKVQGGIIRRQDNSTGFVESSSPIPTASVSDETQGQPSGGPSGWTIAVIIIIALVVALTAILFSYSYLRRLRALNKQPKYLPTSYLKRKWHGWKPKSKYASVNGQDRSDLANFNSSSPTEQVAETGGVDRHTSVRSVITLPAYSRTPKDTEEVIGREGERAGMDTVVEFPETQEEEEGRREDEMESLYQIRVARRQEIAEREERRRERREARERGDAARLEELRQESRARRDAANNSSTTLTAESLIAEHNARGRDRRVSSVAYASVGQVRHDGSRLRANSHDSEGGGLLDNAASMGTLQHERAGSSTTLLTAELPRPRYRDRSDSGALSISTTGSSFDNISTGEVSHNGARPTTASTLHAVTTHSTAATAPEETDLSEQPIVPTMTVTSEHELNNPPDYDGIEWGDAPSYEEAVRRAMSNATIRSARSGNSVRSVRPSGPPRISTLHMPSISIEIPTLPNTPDLSQGESNPSRQ